MSQFSNLGFGLGLRVDHYDAILTTLPTAVDWFEIITEDYLVPGGTPRYHLDAVAAHYPIVMHGVALSIGSTSPLDFDYLAQVKTLAQHCGARWISDHLCWTGMNGKFLHDLLPLPYTEETLRHVCDRVRRAQDFLGQRILLENPSTYLEFTHSTISEWEFMAALAEAADCYILLDVNNIYVSSVNHGFDPENYLKAIPLERVKQFHIAGHHNFGDHIIDTHDAPVIKPVWQLYQRAVQRFPNVPTLLERDDNIPPLETLLDELDLARQYAATATGVASQKQIMQTATAE